MSVRRGGLGLVLHVGQWTRSLPQRQRCTNQAPIASPPPLREPEDRGTPLPRSVFRFGRDNRKSVGSNRARLVSVLPNWPKKAVGSAPAAEFRPASTPSGDGAKILSSWWKGVIWFGQLRVVALSITGVASHIWASHGCGILAANRQQQNCPNRRPNERR